MTQEQASKLKAGQTVLMDDDYGIVISVDENEIEKYDYGP